MASETPPQSLSGFLLDSMNNDLWICLLLVLITIPITLFVPDNALETANGVYIFFGVLRLLLGMTFVVFLPGYAVCRILWPMEEKEDLTIYGIVFGLSIAIAPILGLILNFTPFGLTLISILTTLTVFTLVGIGVAFFRRYQEIVRKNKP